MRSRNGNSYFSLRLYTLIFLHSLVLSASEYLISYHYTVKDALLFNETLQVAHAMQKCQGKEQNSFLLESNGESTLKHIIYNDYENFIDNIHKIGLDVQHREITLNFINTATTTLTLHTTCFKVDFNENFAKITPLR